MRVEGFGVAIWDLGAGFVVSGIQMKRQGSGDHVAELVAERR